MSTFIIGDIHGCYAKLIELIDLLKFDVSKDRVIFVGDIVGRGQNSLEVIEYIASLGDSAIRVLGNHDLNLIATYFGIVSYGNEDEGLNKILTHKNVSQYIEWISDANLLYEDHSKNFVVCHAGIPPMFSLLEASYNISLFNTYKKENGLCKILENANNAKILDWVQCETIEQKLSYILYGFTKMKYCSSMSTLDDQYNDYNENNNYGLKAWFKLRKSHNDKYHIFFGHWAALGLHTEGNITCCDSGCIWNGKLTAIQVDSNEHKVYQV